MIALTPQTMPATIREVLQTAQKDLADAGIDQPQLDAELLLTEALGVRREKLHSHPELEVEEKAWAGFQRAVSRRCRREPMAHILGRKEFWSLEFKVSSQVLIPRPETEHLVEQFLKEYDTPDHPKPFHALDLGTGPGTLAITLAHECLDSRWWAIDSSPQALQMARANAETHGVAGRIEFKQADIMLAWNFLKPQVLFHAIVSNPPYIPSGQIAELMPEVSRYEPGAALDGGPDGLQFYRRIVEEAPCWLEPGGLLFLEMGDGQADPIAEMLEDGKMFTMVKVIPDYSGRERILLARRKADHG